MAAHEDLSREEGVVLSSNRAFGLIFAGFFTLFALWPLVHGRTARVWPASVAVLFLAAALIYPALLAPLNRLWMALALLLNRITNPIATGLIFFLAFVPMAILMRALKKDPLRLAFDRGASSYWIRRDQPSPEPGSMTNQF